MISVLHLLSIEVTYMRRAHESLISVVQLVGYEQPRSRIGSNITAGEMNYISWPYSLFDRYFDPNFRRLGAD